MNPSDSPSSDSSAANKTPQQRPFVNSTPASMHKMPKSEPGRRRLNPESSFSSSRLSRTPTPQSQSQPTMEHLGADHRDVATPSSSTSSRIAAAVAALSTASPHNDDYIPWTDSVHPNMGTWGGPVGPNSVLRTQASTRSNLQNLLSVPEHEIVRDKRLDTPMQMRCELLEHQKVGLTWLIQQEKDKKKGALLADSMGLGKTIQALALILAHESNDDRRKTTLIVAPVALLKQWQSEIRNKVERHYRLKTFIYHGQYKKNMTTAKLLEFDVVLTTYGTVGHEFRRERNDVLLGPDAMFHRIILDEAHNIKNRRSTASEAVCRLKATYRICMTGTPFMNNTSEIYSLIRFLRIEPYRWWEDFSRDIDRPIRKWDDDEHSEAMRRLRALIWSFTLRRSKHSMLDGKRILDLPTKHIVEVKAEFNKDQAEFYNALESEHRVKFENYSNSRSAHKNYMFILVLILRLRQVCSHPHLIKNFGIPDGAELDSDGMVELALDLSPNVVQRVRSQPSFQCPVCNELSLDPIIISPCGHHICSQCFTAIMQIFFMDGRDAGEPGSGSNTPCPYDGCTAAILPDGVICYTYFVRAHGPGAMIGPRGDEDDSETCDSGTEDDDDSPDRKVKKEAMAGSSRVKQEVKREVKQEVKQEGGVQGSIKPIVKTEEATSSLSAVSVAPKENVKRDDAQPESESDPLKDLEDFLDKADSFLARGRAVMAARGKFEPTPDPAAGDVARSRTPKRPIKKEGSPSQPSAKRVRKKDGSYKEKNKVVTLADLKRESQRNATAKAAYLQRLRKDWVSSAKIDATMELLQRLRDEKPDEKILVFSLWTSFLDLLEVPLHDGKFAYARYDGSMRARARDEAIRDFSRKSSSTRVLLVSLTAGNAGLNLTAASQVVVLEPFWNPFVEDQAVDRAHRIGQHREVTVHRVLVAGTIEDRILELQEKKRRLVGAALSEEGARGIGRLSLHELRGLFGV